MHVRVSVPVEWGVVVLLVVFGSVCAGARVGIGDLVRCAR